MSITLAPFQLNAIKQLLECMEISKRDIILKSPTGSGKTIILTHFMDEYLKGHSKTVFIWLTPGKGDLEEQSKSKMDKYIHNSQTKLLSDVMTSGFEENDCCFINWEKLTDKRNVATKESEHTNFNEWVDKALEAGLCFKVIIDESHQNFTDKADSIIQYFKTVKIIRCSATPINDEKAKKIEIDETEVIGEGLIKERIVINENFPQLITTDNYTNYLLDKAISKQQELHSKLLLNKINPLIIVQLPNNADYMLDSVEKYFESRGITYDNGTLAVWLSNKHINKEHIEDNNSDVVAVIIKQAIATGWDCPRAYILVKLRENMDETFEIQTIGRIRRMPEAKHYDDYLLDSCYLYTFDNKFTQEVKKSLGGRAVEVKTLFIKNEYKNVSLIQERWNTISSTYDPRKTLDAIAQYMRSEYNLTSDYKKNKTYLEAKGFVFSNDIVRFTYSGSVILEEELQKPKDLSKSFEKESINTHSHGMEYRRDIFLIGLSANIRVYQHTVTMVGKLFAKTFDYKNKLLNLEPKQLYAFVINNFELLKFVFRKAMAYNLGQVALNLDNVVSLPFSFPHTCLFTYDSENKIQTILNKNIYQGYLISGKPRSASERRFEKFCEESNAINWFYKNGDKGEDYLSIVYVDNSNHHKLFYPDYVLSVNDEIWIIETKGGFTRTGASEDIDIFSSKKFDVLKNYLSKYNLKGGFVRLDKDSDELCICMNNYSDDIKSNDWLVLKEVIK